MDVCNEIKKAESKSISLHDDICDVALSSFFQRVKDDNNFFSGVEEWTYSLGGFIKLDHIKYFNIYGTKHVDTFFEVMKDYDYNFIFEIADAISVLCAEKGSFLEEAIAKYLTSLVISNIESNGQEKYIISSDQFGKFEFVTASKYFRENENVTSYIEDITNIKNKKGKNDCHEYSYFLSKVFSDFYAVTSYCSLPFKGSYFHSYSIDKENNLVIDLANNVVMDKDLYYKLYNPKEISITLNSEVDKKLALVDRETNQPNTGPEERRKLLRIALYEEYLHSEGYKVR